MIYINCHSLGGFSIYRKSVFNLTNKFYRVSKTHHKKHYFVFERVELINMQLVSLSNSSDLFFYMRRLYCILQLLRKFCILFLN